MRFDSNQSRPRAIVVIHPLIAAALVIGGSVLLAACAGYSKGQSGAAKKPDRGIKFSHVIHGEEQGLDCSICHDFESEDQVHMAMPKHDLCSTCHEIPEDLTSDPAKCAFCHTREDYSIEPRANWLTEELKFSHGTHAAKEVACTSCHANIKGELAKQGSLKPMCMDCHGKTDVKLTDCATCHNELNKDMIPTTRAGLRIQHDAPAIWEKLHGQESKVDPKYCAMCHDMEASCDACHRTQAPDNHTVAWRRKTHGIHAGWDRNDCTTCHEEESCMKCHQNASPQSHKGGWDRPTNGHCVSCHFPAQRTNCIVCHEDIEHETAMPSPHDVGLFPANCALCHPRGLPNRAPHLMNSTVKCTVCHR